MTSVVNGTSHAAFDQSAGTSARGALSRPFSSTRRASSVTSARDTSGTMPPQRPECTSASNDSHLTVHSIRPRSEVVSPGISGEGFSQSVSTMTSEAKASGNASM